MLISENLLKGEKGWELEMGVGRAVVQIFEIDKLNRLTN